MAINVQFRDRLACIAMTEHFDFAVHREFKGAYAPLLNNAAIREIEIDLSKVEYMDIAALGMLMLLNERAKDAGKPVALLNASSTASKILEVANFNKIFNVRRVA